MAPPESNKHHDFPADRETQVLLRGLQQLGIEPQAEVPEAFHATVLAHARALPRPRRRTRLRTWRPVWAPVFVVVALVSLGVHVWQGLRAFSPALTGGRLTTLRPLEPPQAEDLWPLYAWQVQAPTSAGLGTLAATRALPPLPRSLVGFTSHAAPQTFLQMGRLYADALALLQSGAGEAARLRLEALVHAAARVQASPVVVQYLQAMYAVLQRPASGGPTGAQMLALVEPLYAHIAATEATETTAAAWVLFRTGAWLEHLGFAATVGDHAALRQAQQELQSLHEDLRALPVPPAILHTLEQIRRLVAPQPLSAQDRHTLQTLADTVGQPLRD